ncbi:hypothetical protein [Campylobacter taeniopygiae]|uniref:hypothetical protein n=1 Tax=Campylobacter taeniopygiae TaxID=2510188 RepID=UPI001FEA7165|nr:hypothetical protein [Campylobacter taeniopygiae]
MERKKIAILVASDQNYDFMLANLIIGLKRWNEDIIANIIVMYDNIDDSTKNKIQSIWPDKIIFRNYSYEQFSKDFGKENLYLTENLPLFKTHLIYTRYYLFELLNEYDYAVWLEPDQLITGSIKNTIYLTQELSGCFWYTNRIEEYVNEYYSKPIDQNKIFMLAGGFIVANRKLLSKTFNNDLTRESFLCLKNYLTMRWNKKQNLEKWDFAPGTDEMVFGLLAYKYNLICQDISSLVNTLPGVSQNSNHIHFVIHHKACNPIFNYAFQEYLINNKIWVEEYNGVDKLKLMQTNMPITSNSKLYTMLYNLESLSYIFPDISKIFANQLSQYKLYINSLHDLPFLDIYSLYFQNKFFFRLVLPGCVRESLYIQIIFKDIELQKSIFNQLVQVLEYYKIVPKDQLLISINVQPIRFLMHSLQNYRLACDSIAIPLNLRPYGNIYSDVNFLVKELLNVISKSFNLVSSLSNMKLEFSNSAKARIQNQLSYKLGQAMIENSKSILGYIRMPYVLSYIKDKHKQEQKIYEEKIKKDPSLKLPPLESYPDYEEALKFKEHLSYKLGEALIRANNNWYGGGVYQIVV